MALSTGLAAHVLKKERLPGYVGIQHVLYLYRKGDYLAPRCSSAAAEVLFVECIRRASFQRL
jgi:hypothetical protein